MKHDPQVSTRMPEAELEELRKVAKANLRSVSAQVLLYIRAGLASEPAEGGGR